MCIHISRPQTAAGCRRPPQPRGTPGRRDVPDEWPELLGALVGAIAGARDGALVAGAVRCLALFVDELGDEQVHQVPPACHAAALLQCPMRAPC